MSNKIMKIGEKMERDNGTYIKINIFELQCILEVNWYLSSGHNLDES